MTRWFQPPYPGEEKTRKSNSLITLGPTCAINKGQFEEKNNKTHNSTTLRCAVFLLSEELSSAKFRMKQLVIVNDSLELTSSLGTDDYNVTLQS